MDLHEKRIADQRMFLSIFCAVLAYTLNTAI